MDLKYASNQVYSPDGMQNFVNGAAYVWIASTLAHERAIGTPNQIGAVVGEWNYYPYNPRGASTGSTMGTAGTAGATEVLIGAGAPVLLGGVYFEADSTANEKVLLRDAAATGTSASNRAIGASMKLELKYLSGLCVCGTAAGVCAIIAWRPFNQPGV